MKDSNFYCLRCRANYSIPDGLTARSAVLTHYVNNHADLFDRKVRDELEREMVESVQKDLDTETNFLS